MTALQIAQAMRHTLLGEDLDAVKVAFLLNLISGMEFTSEQVCNARDCLFNERDRASMNRLLGELESLPSAQRDVPVTERLLADEGDKFKHRLILMLRPEPKMTIEIEKLPMPTDPPVDLYQVNCEDGRGGMWCEVLTSEEHLRAFLRGIRMTFAMSKLRRMLPDVGPDAPLEFTDTSYVERL